MITEFDLQEAIAECEGQRNPTANTCIKLAAFYTIRDHLFPQKVEESPQPVYQHSRATEPNYESDTEFGRLISGMSADQYLPVIDELMTALQVLNPRLYGGVLRKLEN